ncbi:hypothetical protein [Anditalea andensis]|uniref:SPOR domain-containing protein n=1 Tax=Anditalea andensis TaxID=1048983 RepID=A0A074LPP4_9BACT|nr:hypothetical protein [Anditalea andensis]KEO75907.1 hypothetical protein EL17_23115 [Anditalea andensis]
MFFLLHPAFPGEKDPVEDDYEEILLLVKVAKFGSAEIPAAIRQEKVYLSVTDLFDFLHIKNEIGETIQGFVLDQNDLYVIDVKQQQLFYSGRAFSLPSSAFILEDDFVYLRSDLFGEVFGLHCTFNFRTLTVLLSTDLDLPVFKLMRQEMIRKSLNKLHGNLEADTVYNRERSLLKLHIAEWGIMTTNLIRPMDREQPFFMTASQNRYNVALGGEMMGGEFFANLNSFDGRKLAHRNQFYQWRYVNNENAAIRQISVGRITGPSTATILYPVVGIQVTNASTLRRKAFGSYRIADYTGPEWTVELYVNNTLIDFVKADVAGFYTFDVPLIYGNTNIQLMFYGPFGEVQTTQEVINVPYNFLPQNEIEYVASAGLVDDGRGSIFSRWSVNYGLNRRVTVGGGIEYLSSLVDQPFMPFAQSSIKVSNAIMLSADYMPGVRARALMNYRMPKNITLDASYIKLEEGQQAIFFNYLEERKLALSMPIKKSNFSLFSRMTLTQLIFPNGGFTNAQFLVSSRVLGVPTNLSTLGIFRGESINMHSILSQSYRLPHAVSFQPQVQYNYMAKSISNLILRMEKQFFRKGFFNMFYQNNFLFKSSSAGIGFRYDFSFAHVSTHLRHAQNQIMLTTNARGSILYDGTTQHMDFNTQVNLGKGAVTVIPFLDLNNNGKKDRDEPLAKGLRLKVRGGQVQYDKNGEVIRITNLIAYEDYFIELDKNSFDHIAWRVNHEVLKVRVDPNQFKKVEVPIKVMGEASGMVHDGSAGNGIGRVRMNFYDHQDILIHTSATESDGYFTNMELPAGNYHVMPDSVQLEKLGFIYKGGKTALTITRDPYGDMVDDLDFILLKKHDRDKVILTDRQHQSPDIAEDLISLEKKIAKSPIVNIGETTASHLITGTAGDTLPTKGPIGHKEASKIWAAEQSNIISNVTNLNDRQDLESDGITTGQSTANDFAGSERFTLGVTNPGLLAVLYHKNVEEQMDMLREQTKNLENARDTASNTSSASINKERVTKMGSDDVSIAEYQEGINTELPPMDHMRPDDIRGQDQSETHFMVQIYTSPRLMDLNDPVFQGLEVDYYFHKGLYKYTYGPFFNYKEAAEYKLKLWEAGFKDAFVVSFFKRRRLE